MATATRQRKTKKEKRQRRETDLQQKVSLNLRAISPITKNQQKAYDSFWSGRNMMLHGTAGTGKSFISLYLALQSVLVDQAFEKLVIVRSVVPTRDMGFLPGNQKEKSRVYEAPYVSIFRELFGRPDSYDILRTKGIVDFISTSFIRGITLSDCVIVVDEIQNLTSHEANSIITRVGKNCRIIFCGDLRQSDLNKGKEFTGLYDFMKIVKKMKSFDFVEFGTDDICRSTLVKEYILVRNDLEDRGEIDPLSKI